ncbi:S-layer homology domain-containing protein [Paenibacillus sp. IB182496]|uniref:S-layer homology domain-containing protein n=1 Tax=Paenibacillus sabuli TaxID=2772509 RepID=A0A927GSP7_9BACL|nr:S-layer homology domain-containing protein [Paenibacillus sabuli]MBD2846511.1 S-layer homology domain-containing protein [Paenibacillus sabuli]
MDEASIWAQDAIRDAQALGLIDGRGAGRFQPQAEVTRAETAKLLASLLDK